jgi:hypothetical protein
MIEMGIIVALGLLFTLVKMTWRWKMRLLSNPLITDVVIFVLLMLLHWGTFSGVMVATIGALACSATLSAARWLYGYIGPKGYVPGKFDVASKLV